MSKTDGYGWEAVLRPWPFSVTGKNKRPFFSLATPSPLAGEGWGEGAQRQSGPAYRNSFIASLNVRVQVANLNPQRVFQGPSFQLPFLRPFCALPGASGQGVPIACSLFPVRSAAQAARHEHDSRLSSSRRGPAQPYALFTPAPEDLFRDKYPVFSPLSPCGRGLG